MSSVEELAASIEEYNKELTDVSLSLQSSSLSPSDKEQLEELQQNLLQLLELSLDQLQRQQSNEQQKDALDDEMALFQAEIASLESTSVKAVESTTADSSSNLTTNDSAIDVKTLLLSNSAPFVKVWSRDAVLLLEGESVRAPFTEGWGGHTYHNAVVMSVSYDQQCPLATVLFSQPTSLAMLPCRFYLSDSCNYGENCQFSHGYEVSVTDLRIYEEPMSVRENSQVLCKHSDTSGVKRRKEVALLWHNGTVECVLQHSASVNCLDCKEVVECTLDNIITTSHEDCNTPEGSIPELSSIPEPSNEVEEPAPQPLMLGGGRSKDFGHWEKYTKGIGSILMQKMGYTPGAGLGKDGAGRVEPVPAYLYPVGVSVDRCMELRERSGGENMLQVEKRMLRDQKKEEKRQQREDEELSKNSVFDIINNKLSGKGNNSHNEGGKKKVNVGKSHLTEDSTKSLNMKSYHLHTQGRQLEREIEKLEASMERQSKDKTAVENLREKLNGKREELRVVRGAERRVDGEQQARKDAKKYAVF